MDFKANIVRLEKCIIYQPIFIEKSLMEKAKKYGDILYFNIPPDKNTRFGVFYRSNPSLNASYILLGFEYCGSGHSSTMKFESNDHRDIYYNRLIEAIRLAINKLKSDI